MKTRTSLVSNSSTSSFICDVCGEKYTGWDASPSEFDCVECPQGHVMCDSHVEGENEPVLMEGCDHKFDRDKCKFCPECGKESWVEDEDYSLSSKSCPVCNFKIYAEDEMSKYLEITREVSRDEVFAKIKEMNKRRRKLYDAEYITYVCDKFELNDDKLMDEIRLQFKSFQEYSNFINQR